MKNFTTATVDSARQLAVWREIMCDVYYSVDVLRGDKSLRGSIREGQLGEISVTCFDTDEQRVQRTRSCIAQSPDDSYVVVFPRHRPLYYCQTGRSGYIQEGGYVMVSTDDFYELSCPDQFLNWTIKVPGETLRKRIHGVNDHLSAHFPSQNLLADMALGLALKGVDCADSLTPMQAHELGEKVIDLLTMTFNAERTVGQSETHSRFTLRNRAIQFIHKSLDNPELTPAAVASAIGISLSYLHKVFAEHGSTVLQYIIEARLGLAYERLTTPQYARCSVSQIAYDVGFKNVPHFFKAFHKRYGQAPSAFRRMG